MGKLFLIITVLICLFTSGTAVAASQDTITVGRCSIDVIIMQTPEEHSRGLLGYTERTFTYGGMLFDLKRKGRKVFHTVGMQMPIRIMGVSKAENGVYRVVGSVYRAVPGIEAIPIDAPDVLEMTESQYQLKYKRCLMASEGELP